MLRPDAILPAAMAAAMALAACDPSPNAPARGTVDRPATASPGRTPLPVEPVFTGTYRDDFSSVTVSPDPDTIWNCDGLQPYVTLDTLPAVEHAYQIQGDTLHFSVDTEYLDFRPDSSGGRTRAHSAIETFTEFVRVGAGTGLQGRWQSVRMVMRVVKGTPSPVAIRNAQVLAEDRNRWLRYFTWEAEFADGVYRLRLDGQTAQWWVIVWNEDNQSASGRGPNGYYDIEVASRGDDTLVYKGRKSGETVTMVFEGNRRRRYTSDNPAHTSYTESEPETCEEKRQDRWFHDFELANENPPIPPTPSP